MGASVMMERAAQQRKRPTASSAPRHFPSVVHYILVEYSRVGAELPNLNKGILNAMNGA